VAYVTARARAAGFDELAVALLVAWWPLRLTDSPFLIATTRIELELAGDVRLVLHRSA
jgi:hypothetical protein